jgi:DNA-3-methyladenine glycosylase
MTAARPRAVPLQRPFYERADVVRIARDLVGCHLRVRQGDGAVLGGRITEVEAYSGADDLACHSAGGRRTRRNEVMYGPGGHVYTYRCYGIHTLLNIVTNVVGNADAVLIRALEPELGIDRMLAHRSARRMRPDTVAGPGKVSEALGVDMSFLSEPLDGARIWLEPRRRTPAIAAGPRVGINYAGEDALLPWRFVDAETRFVSGPRIT